MIEAKEKYIGKVTFGKDVNIKCNVLKIGDFSHIKSCDIKGNVIEIGKHFYCSGGLRVGGGGSDGENANLSIGDRCVMHNNFINVCEPVIVGNDVGLSPDVSIITHGFWGSVLEGFPRKFKSVKIGNDVVIGYRSLLFAGADIPDNSVIGAQSFVSKKLNKSGIWAGSPVKFLRGIKKPKDKDKMITDIMSSIAKPPFLFLTDGSWVECLSPSVSFAFNYETFEYRGGENEETDDLRDRLRKYGIKIYTERPFKRRVK